LDMSEPTHCKYPHEWQFIVSGSQVDVAYYSAQNDVQATQTFGKFQTALEQLLTGAPLKSPESSAALDVFDEFNF